MIAYRLNFSAHVDYAYEKVEKAVNTVPRIMPDAGGPRSRKKRFLASGTTSILKYGV